MKPLGKKQTISHEQFLEVFQKIEQVVSRSELDALVDRTVENIKATTSGKRAAYSWSGGKDSIALGGVCELAGVKPCVFGMTHGLEYPAFLAWITDHMPHELEVISTGLDLAWLAKHPEMLFPRDSRLDAKWFKLIQHKAQAQYYKKHKLDMLILGRRLGDGNFCGPKGAYVYETKGVTRYSPIAEWRHEDIFAFIHYYKCPIPPIYQWPRGFRVGTGAWPARQWTESEEQGWEEVWTIDPSIVHEAASVLPQARAFLRGRV